MVFRGNVFVNPHASSSAPYPQELTQWNSSIEEPLHSTTVEKSERPEQNQDLSCQSGPSVKDSVIFSRGDSSKNYGADQQRLQTLDLHFDDICLLEDKVQDREMVDSVDELRSSSPTRGISLPNFEVLDARIASALNKNHS